MASRLYFDFAASTPLDPAVFRAMKPYFATAHGNAGSLHFFGQQAIAAVDRSRERIARALNADFREVLFTGSATEANNLALRGLVSAWRRTHSGVPRIIVSSIEHESVLETARALSAEGIELVELPVSALGTIDLKALRTALTANTVLVSIMYVNNETGAVQPIYEAAKIIASARVAMEGGVYPLFHTDASQAFQFLPCEPRALGVDAMTLSAHKIYGPKGVGALYVRTNVPLEAIITGGGQEFGMRSGTENIAGIVGFSVAIERAHANRDSALKHVALLSQRFLRGLDALYKKTTPARRAKRNGGTAGLPHIINMHTPRMDAGELVMRTDLAGLAISSGSACASRSFVASHVLRAMGYSKERALQSVRISFGMPTTRADVDAALRILKQSIQH